MKSSVKFEIDWLSLGDVNEYAVMKVKGKKREYLRRKDGLIRVFTSKNGARKAIWRERNGEYSR